jgi:hypothetical protein
MHQMYLAARENDSYLNNLSLLLLTFSVVHVTSSADFLVYIWARNLETFVGGVEVTKVVNSEMIAS